MPSGHGRDNYTLERMLERRHRNTIRRALGCNGRRLTARELELVNLCARHPDQRYTLLTFFSLECDASSLRLNPYVLPHLPAPDDNRCHHHHHLDHHHQQLSVGPSSNSDRSVSASVVAPLLLQLNVGVNDTNARRTGQFESRQPSTSPVTLPCYFLTDRPESSAPAGEWSSSTIDLIADSIIESLKGSSDKGNSDKGGAEKGSSDKGSAEKGSSNEGCAEKGNSDKGSVEKGSPDKSKSKKSSRKKSKKKKKNRKKGVVKAGPSETRTGSDNNQSEEPCVSSDSSSSSQVETSLVDGDGGNQRVKSDTETMFRCFSSNSSDRCHADVSCSNSMVSSEEGEDMELVLPETVGPIEDAANEDLSALEIDKAGRTRWSSDACISNGFIPVVFRRRFRHGGRFGQQSDNPSQFGAISGRSSDKFSTWQEKSSKMDSGDTSAPHVKDSKPRDSRTKTSLEHESNKMMETSGKPDLRLDANPGPTKQLVYSRKDHNGSGSVARHSGEYIFKKDDFPSLPPPSSNLKEVTRKVGPRLPRRHNWKKPPVPLPRNFPDQCKESESEAGAETKISTAILEVKIGDSEESGSGSSSGAFFSPNSSKSSETNQSSHDTCGLDSPRSSRASDETQSRPDTCPYDPTENNASQSGRDSSSCRDTGPFDSNNSTLTNIDASRSSSLVGNSPASIARISPSTNMTFLDIGEMQNKPAVCGTDLEAMVEAVQASHRMHHITEHVQAAIGYSLADYEILCRCSAPVLDLHPNQIAGVPLRNIWQWYEEPSCYALEVKGCQDHRRLVDFTAHFVPSLSALQLFVRRGLPVMFSKHRPKQGGSESAPGLEDVLGGVAGSAELVFEFFESEQPYFRRTLFDKVKELLAEVVQGSSHVHGNTRHLEELELGDLHPASWYSVAWYPAYRVPEGRSSFKAAFLTYHSLAHFVQVAAAPSVDGRVAVASPVVGLMSYNTMEESWYHERGQAGGEVMVERLRLLNLTAAVMSRARVPRDSQVSGNHHPDFEFFESRSRYHYV